MKILIIEDRKDVQEIYVQSLENTDTDTEYEIVDSRVEAIEMLKRKSFNGAVVDLQLTDNASFGEGIEVVKFINDMNEGTNVTVVSGTPNPIDVVNSYESYDASRFKFVHKDGSSLTHVVKDLLARCEKNALRSFGNYSNINEYFAAPSLIPHWEDALHAALQCGYPIMQNMLHNGFRPFLPILRLKSGLPSFKIDKDRGFAIGDFWSKNTGCAIGVVLSRNDASFEIDKSHFKEIHQKEFGKKVRITVYKDLKGNRADFIDTLLDAPWEENA